MHRPLWHWKWYEEHVFQYRSWMSRCLMTTRNYWFIEQCDIFLPRDVSQRIFILRFFVFGGYGTQTTGFLKGLVMSIDCFFYSNFAKTDKFVCGGPYEGSGSTDECIPRLYEYMKHTLLIASNRPNKTATLFPLNRFRVRFRVFTYSTNISVFGFCSQVLSFL